MSFFRAMFNLLFGQPKAYDLTGADFKAQLNATPNAVLLDVRTAGEVAQGALPGAKNIDIMRSDFAERIQKLDRNATYFVYCRSGNRSGQAVGMMQNLGFKAFNLVGGIGAWPR